MDLFAHVPVPLWLVDYSAARPIVEPFLDEGFDGLRTRFDADPELMRRCCELIVLVDVNRAAAPLLAGNVSELPTPLVELMGDEKLSAVATELAAVAMGRLPFRHDVTYNHGGATLSLDLHLAMADRDDWSRVIVATVNQTERARAVRALRESEERFRTMCQNAPVMIDQFDADGHCILWNRECEQRLGWTHAEIAAHGDPLSLFYPRAEDRDRVLSAIKRADGEFREYRVLAKNGELRDQLWADFRLPSGAQISVGHDITQLREAQARQRSLEEKMWQTQKLESLGVLAGGIAHDFNNLLMGVLANAELARSARGEEREQLLDDIIESARRAADLSSQMLAYTGKASLTRESLDVSALVRDLRPMIAAVVSKKVQLRFELAPNLVVEGDATLLRQAMFNLILNAAEALGDQAGTVHVHLRRETRDSIQSRLLEDPLPAGEYVCVEVTDDGCGMDDDTQARMFDPFFSTKFTGRGLGLASVLGIVHSHGGALEVESEIGVGTTCRAYLPTSGKTNAEGT